MTAENKYKSITILFTLVWLIISPIVGYLGLSYLWIIGLALLGMVTTYTEPSTNKHSPSQSFKENRTIAFFSFGINLVYSAILFGLGTLVSNLLS